MQYSVLSKKSREIFSQYTAVRLSKITNKFEILIVANISQISRLPMRENILMDPRTTPEIFTEPA